MSPTCLSTRRVTDPLLVTCFFSLSLYILDVAIECIFKTSLQGGHFKIGHLEILKSELAMVFLAIS